MARSKQNKMYTKNRCWFWLSKVCFRFGFMPQDWPFGVFVWLWTCLICNMVTDWIFVLVFFGLWHVCVTYWMDVFGIWICTHISICVSLIGTDWFVRSFALFVGAHHQTKSFIAHLHCTFSRNSICILSKCINVLRLRMYKSFYWHLQCNRFGSRFPLPRSLHFCICFYI